MAKAEKVEKVEKVEQPAPEKIEQAPEQPEVKAVDADKPEADKPADKPAAEKPKKEPKSPPPEPEAPKFKTYWSVAYPALFDVLIRGRVLQGHWGQDGRVEFSVPVELVEAFEMHHHFQVGNIKAA